MFLKHINSVMLKIGSKVFFTNSHYGDSNKIAHSSYITSIEETDKIINNISYLNEYFILEKKDNFINIKYKDISSLEYIYTLHQENISKNSQKTIVIDCFGVNIGKNIHIGHLRSGIIGRTIKIILKLLGYNALTDIHMGDFGYIYGVYSTGILDNKKIEKVEDLTINDLHNIYIEEMANEDKDIYHRNIQELYNNNVVHTTLRKKLYDITCNYLQKYMAQFDMKIDLMHSEYRYIGLCAYLQNLFLAKESFTVENNIVKFKDKSKLTRSNGTPLYLFTDVATLVERFLITAVDKVIYVIDKRQEEHIKEAINIYREISSKVDIKLYNFGIVLIGEEVMSSRKTIFSIEEFIDNIKNNISIKHHEFIESGIIYNESRYKVEENYKVDTIAIVDAIKNCLAIKDGLERKKEGIDITYRTLVCRFFVALEAYNNDFNIKNFYTAVKLYTDYIKNNAVEDNIEIEKYSQIVNRAIKKLYKL